MEVAAQNEANENDDAVSSFVSNSSAALTYQYGTEGAKTIDYTEMPKIYVGKQIRAYSDCKNSVTKKKVRSWSAYSGIKK